MRCPYHHCYKRIVLMFSICNISCFQILETFLSRFYKLEESLTENTLLRQFRSRTRWLTSTCHFSSFFNRITLLCFSFMQFGTIFKFITGFYYVASYFLFAMWAVVFMCYIQLKITVQIRNIVLLFTDISSSLWSVCFAVYFVIFCLKFY